jgi:magnesium transporter
MLFEPTAAGLQLIETGDAALKTWLEGGGLRFETRVIWLDLEAEPDAEEEARLLRSEFGIDPIALRDAQRQRHPPKYEAFQNYYFVLLRGLSGESKSIDFQTIQLSLFVGERFVVTRHERPSPSTEAAWKAFAADAELRARGHKVIVPVIGRFVVDRYLAILLSLEPRLDALEEEIVDNPTPDQLGEITAYKSRLKKLRRVFTYHEQIFAQARGSEFATDRGALLHYFNDTHEQNERANSLAALYYDLASDLMESSISMASHRLDTIMKVLTIITAIFVPLGFIAGLYGMNFDNMPELRNPFAYFIVLGIMASVALGSLLIFKWKRWL